MYSYYIPLLPKISPNGILFEMLGIFKTKNYKQGEGQEAVITVTSHIHRGYLLLLDEQGRATAGCLRRKMTSVACVLGQLTSAALLEPERRQVGRRRRQSERFTNRCNTYAEKQNKHYLVSFLEEKSFDYCQKE